MSKCDTCKNRGDCKEIEAHRRFEELVAVGEDVNCTGYEYEKPLAQEDMREIFMKGMLLLGVSKYINGEECFEGEHLDSLINDTPAADVVQVVRCKDCKYFYQDGNIKVCKHWNCHSTTDNAYCSYAKMKCGEE